MRAKQSRLSIIGGCYRLPVSRRITEEFINLTHTVRFGRFRRHTSTGYAQLLAATQGSYLYDPVVLGVLWLSPSTTAHGDGAGCTFEVIHPHHPLRGRSFKLVTYRHNWGEDRVYFHDSGGVLRSIPASWTTVLPEDPFVVLAAGRCLFRYEDLVKLADLVEKAR
jgi:hypothetical protein